MKPTSVAVPYLPPFNFSDLIRSSLDPNEDCDPAIQFVVDLECWGWMHTPGLPIVAEYELTELVVKRLVGDMRKEKVPPCEQARIVLSVHSFCEHRKRWKTAQWVKNALFGPLAAVYVLWSER